MQGLADKILDLGKGQCAFLQRIKGAFKHLPGNFSSAAAARGDDHLLWLIILINIGIDRNPALRTDQHLPDLARGRDISLAKEKTGAKLLQPGLKHHGSPYFPVIECDLVWHLYGHGLLFFPASRIGNNNGFLDKGYLIFHTFCICAPALAQV